MKFDNNSDMKTDTKESIVKMDNNYPFLSESALLEYDFVMI